MTTQPKIYRFELTVSGGVQFPLDMLRYDQAVPASEQDANLITNTINHDTRGRQTVALVAFHHNPNWRPTRGRWESFLWRVEKFVDHKGREF